MKYPDPGLADLRVNPDWAKLPLFDRKGWRTMKFGDFADSINERVEPADAADELYVGLDDLDPGDLHIRRWGKGSDVIGTKLRFRKGDIIFGRRRAYQRKLAVAEFDGICSAHAMVVRAKPKIVLPEFLPFLMMSDRFMKRAVDISVGSLSPTINWTTLKLEEFDLPPLEQQERLLKILKAADEALQGMIAELGALSAAKATVLERLTRFQGGNGRRYSMIPLSEAVSLCQYGLSLPLSATGEFPIFRMMNYDEELVAATDMAYADVPADVAREFRMLKGDILFNRTNSADLVGKVGIFDLEGIYLFASYLVRLRSDPRKMLPRFLNYFLNSRSGQAAVRAYATPGVSQSNVSAGNLKKVGVPIPPLAAQQNIVDTIDGVASATRLARSNVESYQRMLLAIADTAFASSQ